MCHVCAINYTILYALCVLVNINVMYVGAKTKKKKSLKKKFQGGRNLREEVTGIYVVLLKFDVGFSCNFYLFERENMSNIKIDHHDK